MGSQKKLLEAFQAGEARALARAISWVENARPGFEPLLSALHGSVGRARRIGVTGPPGAGKSTLIHALARELRSQGERVGVVAVDPTSPFTGGALLGDRIRMAESATDDGVFIRSMASRGSSGGLATTTQEVADLMDAFGFDWVMVETVGVGQSELEIAKAADTTVVVVTPESGDSVQAMKAGLMEIADIFVLNKGDRPEAERAVHELETMLRLRRGQTYRHVPPHRPAGYAELPGSSSADGHSRGEGRDKSSERKAWEIPVIKTVAQDGEGVAELLAALQSHLGRLRESGELAERRRNRLMERVRAVVERGLRTRVWEAGDETLESARADLESGRRSPYAVAQEILKSIGPA